MLLTSGFGNKQVYGYAMTSAFPCVYSQCSQLNKALPFPPSCYMAQSV